MDHMTALGVTVYKDEKGIRRADITVGNKNHRRIVSVSAPISDFSDQILLSCSEVAHRYGCLFGVPKEREEVYNRLNELHGYERYSFTIDPETKPLPNSAWHSPEVLDFQEHDKVE